MSPLNKTQVLALLRKKKRALHVGELAGRFGVKGRAQDKLSAILAELVSRGSVQELPGGRFQASSKVEKGAEPRRESERPQKSRKAARSRGKRPGPQMVGRLSMHPSGFGFVAPELGGDDVFIPPSALESAIHGDLVEVITRKSAKGTEGEVTSVVRRGVQKLTGVLRRDGRNHVFHPDNARIPGPSRSKETCRRA